MALIVVAADEHLLAFMLADILEDEGHEVATAAHGQDALEQIRTRRPALLITDFMMPVMTGLELAQAIRADQESPICPSFWLVARRGRLDANMASCSMSSWTSHTATRIFSKPLTESFACSGDQFDWRISLPRSL